MSRRLKETGQYKTDKNKIKNSGRYDWQKMRDVVKELMNDRPLAQKHLDHPLTGLKNVRECHIEPDWLLIYEKKNNVETGDLQLIRTGSHSDLF